MGGWGCSQRNHCTSSCYPFKTASEKTSCPREIGSGSIHFRKLIHCPFLYKVQGLPWPHGCGTGWVLADGWFSAILPAPGGLSH